MAQVPESAPVEAKTKDLEEITQNGVRSQSKIIVFSPFWSIGLWQFSSHLHRGLAFANVRDSEQPYVWSRQAFALLGFLGYQL